MQRPFQAYNNSTVCPDHCLLQDLSDGTLAVGSRSQVLAVQYGGPVRFTAAVSSLKWAYQPMFVEPLRPAAAEEVRHILHVMHMPRVDTV